MGNIWFSEGNNFNTGTNFSVLNKVRNNFYSIYDTLVVSTGLESFGSFLAAYGNDIYLNSRNGYSVKFDAASLQFEKIRISDKYSLSRTIKDQDNNLWFAATGEGLVKYMPETKEKIIYSHDNTRSNSIAGNDVIELYLDETGVFWVGTGSIGFSKFDPSSILFNLYTYNLPDSENPEPINDFYQSGKYYPKIWLGSLNGFRLFDPENGELDDAVNRIPELVDTHVRAITEKDDVLWIGTWGKGLFRIDLNDWSYKQYKPNASDSKALVSNFVRTLYFDSKDDLWIGNDVGLHRLNELTDEFERFKFMDTTYLPEVWEAINDLRGTESVLAEINKVGDSQNITKQVTIDSEKKVLVTSIGESFSLQDGTLWDYGWLEDSYGETVWRFDSLNSLHAGGDNKNRISSDVLILSKGTYYLRYKSDDSHSFGAWNASVHLYPEYWGVQLYELTPEQYSFFNERLKVKVTGQSIPGDNIRTLYDDGAGKLWIGTNNSGFGFFDHAENRFKSFETGTSTVTNFSRDRVNSFLKDSDGRLWIASFGGLMQFDYKDETVKDIRTSYELPTNYLSDLIEDQQGDIWISSLNGIVKFQPKDADEIITFNSYDISDGLQDFNFIQGASLKLSTGLILFGGSKGFNSFYPGNENQYPPKIVVNSLLISNKIVTLDSPDTPLRSSIELTDSIELKYSQNDFALEYTAIHYSKPEKNQYAYMLKGFDEDWIYDNRRFASYTNLDEGEYEFLVKAANSDGVWSNSPKSIKINILPPWWRTTLAYFFYGAVLIFGFITLDRLQRRRILAKERERQKVQEAELRAVAAEAQARAIQAENDRKTKELDEARKLQLSMLPEKLPDLSNLDIAVFMSTATEVGGDYYDFHIDLDGTLTVVIGDATGHGLNAGTVVTATKSLFSTHATNPDIIYTFGEISRCLKEMRLRLLSMCLMILKIKGNELVMSAAGMPPALILRADGTLDELLIKGMPLGTPASFPYEVKNTTLSKGDTILLMSDGFPELFNEQDEMFGYRKVFDTFEKIGEGTPADIIGRLKKAGDEWKGNREQDDDITFVAIKVKA